MLMSMGLGDYEITYSVRYGDTVIGKATIIMKGCTSKRNALEAFNKYFTDRSEPLTDPYIHSITKVPQ